MIVKTIRAGIVALMLRQAALPPQTQEGQARALPAILVQTDRIVSLEFCENTWTFRPSSEGKGLRIFRGDVDAGDHADLTFNGELGEVLSFDVQARQWSPKQAFVGVALALLAPDGRSVEYRFLFGRTFGDLLDESSWSYSTPLITAPLAEPFEAMSVNLLGGDSILVTLQDVARMPNGSGDKFITHRFIHHCPQAGHRLEQTRHYVDTAEFTGPVQAETPGQ